MRARLSKLRSRRGALMVVVLICMLIILMMSAVLLKVLLAHRDQARADGRRLQAEWLAESGLERAQAKLAASAAYQGEVWDIPAEALAGGSSGRVTIQVSAIEGQPQQRLVRASAEFPHNIATPVRHSKQLTLTVKTESSGDQP